MAARPSSNSPTSRNATAAAISLSRRSAVSASSSARASSSPSWARPARERRHCWASSGASTARRRVPTGSSRRRCRRSVRRVVLASAGSGSVSSSRPTTCFLARPPSRTSSCRSSTQGCARVTGAGARSRPSPRWGSRIERSIIQVSSPAASSSVSPLRARSWWARVWYSPMSRPAPSTRGWADGRGRGGRAVVRARGCTMTMLLEQWRIALGALAANWFRAALTALGVVIGVASLVGVTAVSAGAQSEVADSISRLGGNVVKVDGEFINVGTGQSATDRTITPEDVAAIAKLPMVTAVAPHQDIESIVVSAGRYKTNTWLVGMTESYAHIQNQHAVTGRLISAADVGFGRSVIVLGLVAAEQLFPGQNPIGKTVRVGNREFEVIGIQNRRGKLADENLDNRIFVPLPIVTRVLLGGVNTVHVDALVRSDADIEPALDAITALLRTQHKLPESYPDDFSAEDQASIVKEGQRATTTFRVLTFALGGIALLVGGIGIMNMMLVSVRERTREIGIRKSVGADPRTVQLQFLVEAVVLSTFGGIAGVFTGIAATKMVSAFAGWQTLISSTSLVLSFLVALCVGLFFGYYPARRAARLDPIAALRYE